MIAHTVTAYDEELKSLRQKIFHMGGLAEHQVMTAMSAIAGADPKAPNKRLQAMRRSMPCSARSKIPPSSS